MKCPSCGCDNLPGADSCENCQASLSQVDVPQPVDAVELGRERHPGHPEQERLPAGAEVEARGYAGVAAL